MEYIKSKFPRYLHSLTKRSKDATAKPFRFVPMQNFTDKEDIDWSKSINKFDEQLFDKYDLLMIERKNIESSIKKMQEDIQKEV